MNKERFKSTHVADFVHPFETEVNPRQKYYDIPPKHRPYGLVTECLDWPGYDMFCAF